MRGFVSRWPINSPFGFITDFNEEIYYVHKSEVQMPNGFRKLHGGMLVEFDAVDNLRDKKRAVNVVPIRTTHTSDRYFKLAEQAQDELEVRDEKESNQVSLSN